MSKQETLRYDGYGLFVNGVQCERITSVSMAADYGTEDVLQLSDSSIVQKVDQTPDVSITVEANFIGGVDNLKSMSNQMLTLTRTTAQIATNADNRYSNVGNGDTAYRRYDRIRTASANEGSITHLDILNSYCDLTIPMRDGTTSIGRTLHIHRAALTGWSMSLDVNGNATESFNLNASNRYWFLNNWKAVRPYVLSNKEIVATVAATGTNPNSQRFWVHSVAAFHSASCVAIFAGVNKALRTNTNFTFVDGNVGTTDPNFAVYAIQNDDVSSDTWANPFVSSPSGSSRDDVILMLKPVFLSQTYAGSSAANPGFELNSTAGSLGAMARQYADVYVYNTNRTGTITSTAEGRLLRCQSVTVDVSPETEPKYQIGDKEAYSTFRKTPVNVTGTFSVLSSDLELQGILMSTGAGADDSSGPDVMTIDDLNAYNNMAIRFYQEEAKSTLLSTLVVTGFKVSNETVNTSVGGEGAEEFSFTADNMTFTGTGVDPSGS